MLKNMHRGSVHTGKVPARLAQDRRRSLEMTALQSGLQKAVDEEKFEEAAIFRDKIRRLESELKQCAAVEGQENVAVNRHSALEKGKEADLVIMESDPNRTAPEKLGAIKVSETWVAGTRRYAA
jgi:hypothetical protein